MTNAASASPQDWARLSELISGYQRSELILTAAKLGLADLLANGPKSADQLAAESRTHSPSLGRLLRALVGFGLFEQRDDGRFVLTPAGALLCDGVPNSLRPMALVAANDTYNLWANLYDCIRTGNDGFALAYGISGPEYRDRDPEANKNFNAWMAENMRRRAGALLQNYKFPDSGLVVDVGGGDGSLVASILQHHTGLNGIVFDLERVVRDVDPASLGLTGRLSVEAGSFFDGVPANGDVYILSLILHNWPDDQAVEILRQLHKAMKPTSKLIILDQVMPAVPQPSMSDLNMLVNCGALERSEPQWRSILHEAGFEVTMILSSPSLVEAMRSS